MSVKKNKHQSVLTQSGKKKSGKITSHKRSTANSDKDGQDSTGSKRSGQAGITRRGTASTRHAKPYGYNRSKKNDDEHTDRKNRAPYKGKPASGFKKRRQSNRGNRNTVEAKPRDADDGLMRLNKYVAHAGICSRRDADQLIVEGKVRVNGKVVTELGTKVHISDKIELEGRPIEPEPYVYLLMYKPHNTITTTSDEKERRTVMDLVEQATGKRVYPVGRLDRNTTGVLLLTNDGELANRLMHPSYRIGKIYEVTADKTFSNEELAKLKAGVTLEDGDASAYFIEKDPVHSNVFLIGVQEGRNHLVRRMVEVIGGDVQKLKRVKYAGLTLKGLRPGRWRSLYPDEINRLRETVKLRPLKITRKKG